MSVRSAFPKDLLDENIPVHPCDYLELPSQSGVPRRLYEHDYCEILNRELPMDIRAVGWAPVTVGFSARFSACHRVYRYFFIHKDLDIVAMRTATEKLLGQHDFRNLAKLDVINVSNFKREIYSATITLCETNPTDERLSTYMLEIRGNAFLWHM